MTIEELIAEADRGNISACGLVASYYLDNNEYNKALPYVEKTAEAGDQKGKTLASMLQALKGEAILGIGGSNEDALHAFEKGLVWANEANDTEKIVRAKQGIGECCFRQAVQQKDKEVYFCKRAYTVLSDVVGKDKRTLFYDMIWALSVGKMQELGYNLSNQVISSKIDILLDVLKNREEITKWSVRAEQYIPSALVDLGFILLEGKEANKDDDAAYFIFNLARKEYGIGNQDFFNHFIQDINGKYHFYE